MFFHKYLYLLGERLRNPLIRKKLEELKQTDFTSLETLEELQLSRLKKLLHHARENCLFYAKRFDNIEIDSMTLSELKKIPPLSKKELYDNEGFDWACSVKMQWVDLLIGEDRNVTV